MSDGFVIKWLAAKGWTLKDLAQSLGVTVNTLAKWCSNPPNSALLALHAIDEGVHNLLPAGTTQEKAQEWYVSRGWDDRAMAAALGLPIGSVRFMGRPNEEVPAYLLMAMCLVAKEPPPELLVNRSMTGDDLALWRKRLGLTTSVLASALGYTQSTVFLWESGASPIPRAVPLALPTLAKEVEAGCWPVGAYGNGKGPG